MIHLSKKRKKSVSLNLVSMTDIVLLLLIFCMLSMSAITKNGIDIALPQSSSELESIPELTFYVDQAGNIYHNNKQISLDQIPAVILAFRDKKPDNAIIYIDKNLTIEKFIQIAELIAKFNISLSIATTTDNYGSYA